MKDNNQDDASSMAHCAAHERAIGARPPRPPLGTRKAEGLRRADATPAPWRTALSWLLFLAFALLAFYVIFWTESFIDNFRLIGYEMPAEISAIESKLHLTSDGHKTFAAVHPTIEASESFNEHCNSHNKEISVLGCYYDNSIYIYDIHSDELSGIIESTAAHEMLHAAWDRLAFWDQNYISGELQKFYESHADALSEELEDYKEDSRIDELHSRVGTEFADLPESLENYYARYFTNQDAIVAYYDNYEEKFRSLQNRLDELDASLDEMSAEIDAMGAEYDAREKTFNDRVDQFNSCAETPDCFTDAEFASQRAALLSERDELSASLSELNAKIDKYNALVDEYESNVLHRRNLHSAINSNSEPESPTDNQ